MKLMKKYLAIVCISLWGYNSYGQNETEAFIYTPKGSRVEDAYILSGLINPTYNDQQISTLETLLYNLYDGATLVGTEDYRYNCHAYAWHMVDNPNAIPVWIGRYTYTAEDIYWTDSSYIEVPEAIATKVSYNESGNHSAVRENSTWYRSKWGGGLLVRHHPNAVHNGSYNELNTNSTNFFPLAQKTYYMRNPNCSITGLELIASGYVPYSVHNLPSGCSVSWFLNDSYYNQHCLITPSNTNTCYIFHDISHDMMDATLTATVKYDNVAILTVDKTVYSYDGFWGQYTSGNLSGNINYTCFFNIKTNSNTTIFSPNLYGATVSYSSSGAIPSSWSHNPNSGVVSFYTTNTSIPVIINVHDGCGNDYVLYAYPTSLYSMNISNEGNCIIVTLVEEGDASKEMILDQAWTLEVRNATTGVLIATKSSTSRSESISTVGWTEGVYIVKVIIGKEELTGKAIVK